MKTIHIEQNSEDWLEFRKGKSGGSEFKDLYVAGLPLKSKIIKALEKDGQPLSPADKKSDLATLAGMLTPEELVDLKLENAPKKHYHELIADRVCRPITPNDYADRLNGQSFSMMARGHILEGEAAEAFSKKTGKELYGDVVWVSDEDESIYISPDRIVKKDGEDENHPTEAVEIKCLGNDKVVEAYLTNSYPKEYDPQILKYFMVCETLQTLHFVIYTDTTLGLDLQIFEIHRRDVEDKIYEAQIFEQEIMRRLEADAEKIEALAFKEGE